MGEIIVVSYIYLLGKPRYTSNKNTEERIQVLPTYTDKDKYPLVNELRMFLSPYIVRKPQKRISLIQRIRNYI